MHIYFKIILYVLVIFGSQACTKDFESINTNPNAPVEIQPELLFRNILYSYGEKMSYEGFVAGNLLGQYTTSIDFNLFDRHSLSESQFGGNPWPILYATLRDIGLLIELSESKPTYAVYRGPALILKAYVTSALTDMFGDVPYSQALQGKSESIITPAYDSQELIYLGAGGILDNLMTGVASIQSYNSPIALNGDILYNGELSKWLKFGESLRLKALVRISAREDVSAELNTFLSSTDLIVSNSDNATFDFTDGEPNNFRMATARIGDFNLYVMSETMQTIMTQLGDPRMTTLFRPRSVDGISYQGLRNGPDASATSISVADYSLTGEIFRESTGSLDANFLTAAEVCFLLAEVAQSAGESADAQAWYEQGVRLSFEYWLTPMPENYLTTGSAAFDTESAMEQILTQKWLTNMCNGYESWIEYKRTGFPTLLPVQASLNNDIFPIRLPYPPDEQALNQANYQLAAQSTDNNSINSPVWWDVN